MGVFGYQTAYFYFSNDITTENRSRRNIGTIEGEVLFSYCPLCHAKNSINLKDGATNFCEHLLLVETRELIFPPKEGGQ